MSLHMEPPPLWMQTIENIRKVRKKFPAPVDTMGCDMVFSKDDTARQKRFQILCALMISSQTKDQITWAAVKNLRDHGLASPDALVGAQEKDIEQLIHPAGFYRRKAIYLKKVAQILKEKYDGDIPKSIDKLCELPGVGPKMAHLCMAEAWGQLTGIGVDTHVHRIAALLEWVPKKGVKSPEDTRKALESWLPREYWHEINHMLVGFGQTICTSTRPKCGECYNNSICPARAKFELGTKAKSGAKVKVEPQVKVKIARRAKAESETKTRVESETQTKAKPKVKVKLERRLKTKLEPNIGPQVGTVTESKLLAKLEPNFQSQVEVKIEPGILAGEPHIAPKAEREPDRKRPRRAKF